MLQQGQPRDREFEPVSLESLKALAESISNLRVEVRAASRAKINKADNSEIPKPKDVEDGLKIIGFVGMPGSGKGEASDVARSMGLVVVVMGDIIRQEAARLGLELTDENLGKVGNLLRSQEGPEAVARRTLEIAELSGKDLVVIDGIRSKAEVDFFREHAKDFRLIEVWTPPEARLNRVLARGRSDDANGGSITLQKRDCRELGWGMNEAILQADLRLSNDGDLLIFKKSVQKLLENIISCKGLILKSNLNHETFIACHQRLQYL